MNRIFFGAACVLIAGASAARAATPYDGAVAALTGIEADQNKELDGLLARPADAALRADARAAALLGPNRPALDLFRTAAFAPTDGYLFAPKVDDYDAKTPIPNYVAHVKLFKLLVLDAKLSAAAGERRRVESDLLAAVGFIAQVSAQKSGALISDLVAQLAMAKAYGPLLDSVRDRGASPAYLKQLAAELALAARSQDYMSRAFLEEDQRTKGSMHKGLTLETFAKDREKLSFTKRFIAEKLQDEEYRGLLLDRLDAAGDTRTQAIIAAFRANDPAPIQAYEKKRAADAAARKEEVAATSYWARFVDGANGGHQVRRDFAQITADALLGIARPDFIRVLPRCHALLSELSVLRTGLALELYRRARKRPPTALAQLVPDYLSEIPQDTFDGFKPLRYAATPRSFLVYGFGPDHKDHGGLPLDADAFMAEKAAVGDFVFRD